MGSIIWLFSDNYPSDVQAAKMLAEHGFQPVFAWCVMHFDKPGKLTWQKAKALIRAGFEVHNHAIEHENWTRPELSDGEVAARLRDSWLWWDERYGPEFAACRIMGVPYTSSPQIRSLALAGGVDWGPFIWTLTNWLDPEDSIELPGGYEYRWETAYCSQGTADMEAAQDWVAGADNRVLFAAFHALVDKAPPNGGQTLRSQFHQLVHRAAGLGLDSTGVLGLAVVGD